MLTFPVIVLVEQQLIPISIIFATHGLFVGVQGLAPLPRQLSHSFFKLVLLCPYPKSSTFLSVNNQLVMKIRNFTLILFSVDRTVFSKRYQISIQPCKHYLLKSPPKSRREENLTPIYFYRITKNLHKYYSGLTQNISQTLISL